MQKEEVAAELIEVPKYIVAKQAWCKLSSSFLLLLHRPAYT